MIHARGFSGIRRHAQPLLDGLSIVNGDTAYDFNDERFFDGGELRFHS